MSWTQQQIEHHLKAAEALVEIKNQVFRFIKNNSGINEHKIQQFIKQEFKNRSLITRPNTPIIAFRQNTSFVHYYPPAINSQILKPKSLILLDLWGKLDKTKAPFADITWMAYYGGEIPKEIQKVFEIVLKARNKAIDFIRANLKNKRMPSGIEIDGVVRNFIYQSGYKNKFPHSTGHALGLDNPHGKEPPIAPSAVVPLEKSLGYTIEPGIYLPGRFGVRSEINFYIDAKDKLVITSEIQKNMTIL